jgi:hypothetical protein
MDERGMPMRIGDEERQAALEALTAHREAGRLESTEFEERQVIAARARTWAEIGPLFVDLPQPHPTGMPPELAVAGQQRAGVASIVGDNAGLSEEQSGASWGAGFGMTRRTRETLMALAPFAALLLFFSTRYWQWFLMIPILAIILFGPDAGKQRRR